MKRKLPMLDLALLGGLGLYGDSRDFTFLYELAIKKEVVELDRLRIPNFLRAQIFMCEEDE